LALLKCRTNIYRKQKTLTVTMSNWLSGSCDMKSMLGNLYKCAAISNWIKESGRSSTWCENICIRMSLGKDFGSFPNRHAMESSLMSFFVFQPNLW
jgi:hypothetical protein